MIKKIFCQGTRKDGTVCNKFLADIGPSAIIKFPPCSRPGCKKRTELYEVSLDSEELANFSFNPQSGKIDLETK